MVDVDEVQGYRRKHDNQLDRLAEAEIDDRDREAIREWVTHLRAGDSTVESLGTVVSHLNRIRLAAERSAVPLVEFEGAADVNAFKVALEDEFGLAAGTIRNYMKALRKFFAWLDRAWATDVVVGSPPEREHDPEAAITDEEMVALLDACNEFEPAAREKAMLALLRDTALRIGAVLSLRVRDVDPAADRPLVTINSDGPVKGASGRKPLVWSHLYCAQWLDQHPRRDDPDAAFIHKTRGYGDDEDGALRYQYAAARISRIAEAAGLDPDRVHAHLFRGTAISEWILRDLGEQGIKHRVDWDEDSREFATYSRVTDQEMNDYIYEHFGVASAVDEVGDGPRTEFCPNPRCGEPLLDGVEFCPGCGAAVAAASQQQFDDAVDELIEADRAGVPDELVDAVLARIRADPSVLADVVEDGAGGGAGG